MKKLLLILTVCLLAAALCTACAPAAPETPAEPEGGADETPAELQKIVVGATPAPHAEILAVVKDILLEQGYELEIREFTEYIQPNLALDNGDLDANYFQHQPYLDDFNAENKTDIIALAGIHFEPLGIYPGKTASLEELADGAQIAVPNDTTNEARALLLLEAEGLIKVNMDAGLKTTVNDITENNRNFRIVELEAAQLARSLPDVEIAVINGNFAIQAGLNAAEDALAKEDKDSLAAETFANILAIRNGDENREDLQALAAALQSEEVRQFIEEKYQGAVVPVF